MKKIPSVGSRTPRRARSRWGVPLMMGLLLLAWLYVGADTFLGGELSPWRQALGDTAGYVGEPLSLSLRVPSLVGERFSEDALPDPQLFPCEVTYVYHPAAKEGTVLEQVPRGGAYRKVSIHDPCVISLTVSMGRECSRLPDLTGLDPREAEITLGRLGLLSRRVYVTSRTGESTVLVTKPTRGALLERGETVTLLVARPTAQGTLPCPDLTGLTAEQAAATLGEAGLTLGETRYSPVLDPWGIRERVVCAQTHTAGSCLPYGHAVGITLG